MPSDMDYPQKLDQFLKIKKAGEGTYGVVYKAKHKITGKYVALKQIKVEKYHEEGDQEGIPSTAIREICLLKGLHHSSIIELMDVILVKKELYLVFEFLDTDLTKYINGLKKNMSENLIKSYMKQLFEGLSYLHAHRIFHRDLKPQNLLLDKEGHIKIADFGLSRSFSIPTRTYTHEVVTLWYRAPELLLGERMYSIAVDIWSLGCIMAEMITRKALFPGDSEIDQLFKIFKILGTPTDKNWPGVSLLPDFKPVFPMWKKRPTVEFLPTANENTCLFFEKLVVYKSCDRLTAFQAINDPYFKDVRLTCPDLDCFA